MAPQCKDAIDTSAIGWVSFRPTAVFHSSSGKQRTTLCGKPTRWLWHGRARVAESYLKELMYDSARLATEPLAVQAADARVHAHYHKFYTYLADNTKSCVDFGRRYRSGLPISSSCAEGPVLTLPMPEWESAEG